MTVDEFVENKVLPEFRPVVAAIRSLMKETAPGAKEVISYGTPMYIQNQTLAWITPNKKGITFGFTHGAERWQSVSWRGVVPHPLGHVQVTALKP